MKQDILDAIKKNLPEMVAGELKEHLENYDVLEINVKKLEDQLETLTTLNKNLEKENVKLKKLNIRSEELDKKEMEVNAEKRNLKVTMAELKAEEANKRSSQLYTLVDKVFGHPNVTITKTTNQAVPNDHYISTNYETDTVTNSKI